MRGGVVALGCRVRRLAMSSPCLALGAPFKSQAAWNVVEDCLNRRLVSWGEKKGKLFKGTRRKAQG